MARQRSLSGTIPSMETSHDELKDNTIIVGEYSAIYNSNIVSNHPHTVLGASGDLAKKKVCRISPD